jgi:hypothetical protein
MKHLGMDGIILKQCATSRKVTGSSPDEVDFFNNPPSSTVFLGSTHPLTEMSSRDLPGSKSGRRLELTTLSPSGNRMSENVGASTSRNPKGLQDLYSVLLYRKCTYKAVLGRIQMFRLNALSTSLFQINLCLMHRKCCFILFILSLEFKQWQKQ